jgi:Domain of unknown function (DUF3644)
MTSSSQLAEKSMAADLAAIEIYNKPNFVYREESFSILINAWELLLKAKLWQTEPTTQLACSNTEKIEAGTQ